MRGGLTTMNTPQYLKFVREPPAISLRFATLCHTGSTDYSRATVAGPDVTNIDVSCYMDVSCNIRRNTLSATWMSQNPLAALRQYKRKWAAPTIKIQNYIRNWAPPFSHGGLGEINTYPRHSSSAHPSSSHPIECPSTWRLGKTTPRCHAP